MGVGAGVLLVAGMSAYTWAPGDVAGTVHTQLEESWPRADSTEVTTVAEIRLRFSTAVQAALSRIRLIAPDGSDVRVGALEAVPGTEDMQIRVAVAGELTAGVHTVEWGTAGPDSHPISGAFSFTFDPPARAPEPESATESEPDTALVMAPSASGGSSVSQSSDGGLAAALAPMGLTVRWLYFLTIALMVGIVAFQYTVVAPASARGEPAAPAALKGLFGLGVLAGLLALAVAAARLGIQHRALFGAAAPEGSFGTLISQSAWGRGWVLYVLGALLLVAGAWAGRVPGRSGAWALAGIGALLAVASRVPSGHAWGVGTGARPLAIIADGGHMLGAGLWVGGLAVLALIALPALTRTYGDERAGDAALWVAGFSRIALIGFLTLAVSGAISATIQLGSVDALFQSIYGRTLIVKIVLLALPAALGFYHWRVIRPRLASEVPAGFRRTATIEFAVALLVVSVAAVLVVLHLPEH